MQYIVTIIHFKHKAGGVDIDGDVNVAVPDGVRYGVVVCHVAGPPPAHDDLHLVVTDADGDVTFKIELSLRLWI